MSLVKKSLSAVVVFMLGTLISYANVKVISKNTKAVKVVFENVQKNHPLTIVDSEGIILHKENVVSNGYFVKFFDFSSLKEGEYKIEIDRDFETLIRTFEVKRNEVLFNTDSDIIVFKPVVLTKNNSVLLSRINFDKAPMYVSIYYKNVLIVDEVIISDNNIIEKSYKLDEELKGAYKVIVHNNEKSVIKEFSL